MRDAVLLHGVAGHNYRKVAVITTSSTERQVRVEARRLCGDGGLWRSQGGCRLHRARRGQRGRDEASHRWRPAAAS